MENYAWLYFGLGLAVLAATTWALCRWWFGRQLAAVEERLDKVDKARIFTGQQLMHARKQIETLQQDLAQLKRTSPPQGSVPVSGNARQADVPQGNREGVSRSGHPANGFADTQAME